MDKERIARLISFDDEGVDPSTGYIGVNQNNIDYAMNLRILLEMFSFGDTPKKFSEGVDDCSIELEWHKINQSYILYMFASPETPDTFPEPCNIVVYAFGDPHFTKEYSGDIYLSDILEGLEMIKTGGLRSEVGEWMDYISEDMESVDYETEDTDIFVEKMTEGLEYLCKLIKETFKKHGRVVING